MQRCVWGVNEWLHSLWFTNIMKSSHQHSSTCIFSILTPHQIWKSENKKFQHQCWCVNNISCQLVDSTLYLPTQVNEFLSFSLQTFVALLNINFEAFVSDIYVSWKISARSQFSKQWIMQSFRLTLWDQWRKRCWCCKSSKWVQRSEWVRDGVNSVK